ncbi:hypothetical protein DUNSADRAFT_6868 [Dunaliella salina]|uniref:Secreted protein n=1 Tax=Dunaliella salina TaxID=3046 RepID=A0ABQ7GME1_DUNSA|nr:hypothetical protein DUNSADRAFT_6868 [Dunaliella salina]|eukprot:KAF5835779.1 hypothetical protein DUNSADRAFT_6868 [Dunaliella salina]
MYMLFYLYICWHLPGVWKILVVLRGPVVQQFKDSAVQTRLHLEPTCSFLAKVNIVPSAFICGSTIGRSYLLDCNLILRYIVGHQARPVLSPSICLSHEKLRTTLMPVATVNCGA